MTNTTRVAGIFNPIDNVEAESVNFLRIGITGGIGSGKSFVCKVFGCLGIPVYEADNRAKWLTENHSQIRNAVIDLLGKDAYTLEGNYNRSYVSSIVFEQPQLLKELNQIIHPVVGKDSEDWMQEIQNSGRFPYALKEAAIMNKAGIGNNLDYVISVTAPEQVRLQRVLLRDSHRTEAEIRNIISNQISDEQRLENADFVIINDGNQPLLTQVIELHKQLLRMNTALS